MNRVSQDIIIKPIVSEKSFSDAGKGKYTFLVALHADKILIKNTVERLFDVKVTKVSTSVIKGTTTRFTRKGKKVNDITYKKARVQLQKGQKLAVFEELTSAKKS